MKIKWGALVVDGRGKLGGHVASKNRGGNFLRTKVTPSNPSTLAQTFVRVVFAIISTGWSLLTGAQRATWNNAVEDFSTTDIFGDIKKPSGKNLHQKLNQNLLLVGENVLTTAPSKLAFPSLIMVEAAIDITANTILLSGDVVTTAANKIIVSSTGPLTNGTSNAKNRFRNIYASPGNDLAPVDVFSGYVARFGLPSLGENIQIGFQVVLPSGQKSPMQIVIAVVSA